MLCSSICIMCYPQFSFFQRIKDGSLIDSVKTICVGDHIESVNGESIIGWRHYDVAKKLKELKKDEPFTLKLVEPKKGFGKLGVDVYVCEVFPFMACLSISVVSTKMSCHVIPLSVCIKDVENDSTTDKGYYYSRRKLFKRTISERPLEIQSLMSSDSVAVPNSKKSTLYYIYLAEQ